MISLSVDRWSRVAMLVSATAATYTLLDLESPLRVLVVLAFLLFVPGTALVRLLRLDDPAAELALGTGLSVSLAGLVAGVLLYAGLWSPGATLTILIGVTLPALAVELERADGGVTRGAARVWALRADVVPVARTTWSVVVRGVSALRDWTATTAPVLARWLIANLDALARRASTIAHAAILRATTALAALQRRAITLGHWTATTAPVLARWLIANLDTLRRRASTIAHAAILRATTALAALQRWAVTTTRTLRGHSAALASVVVVALATTLSALRARRRSSH